MTTTSNKNESSKVKNSEVEKTEIQVLKEKLAKMEEERKAQMDALKAKMKELNEEAKALKEQEKEAKAKIKAEEAKTRAKNLASSLAMQNETKRPNLTEAIKQMMLQGKTVDEMVVALGVERKAILDRRWLIEKRAGLR